MYEELQNCLLEGIRDNIERATLSGDVQLVEKLRDGQIQEREEERVNIDCYYFLSYYHFLF